MTFGSKISEKKGGKKEYFKSLNVNSSRRILKKRLEGIFALKELEREGQL